MNFGLAERPEEAWTLNHVAYMSPEQLAHRAPTAHTDLYSLGVLLYELLTGCLPFESNTVKGLIERSLNAPPAPPRDIRAEIPVQLERIVLQLLSKDPRLRQPSANAALKELAGVELEENPAVMPAPKKDTTVRGRCQEDRTRSERA
jgi:serine/threonine protein kinase